MIRCCHKFITVVLKLYVTTFDQVVECYVLLKVKVEHSTLHGLLQIYPSITVVFATVSNMIWYIIFF